MDVDPRDPGTGPGPSPAGPPPLPPREESHLLAFVLGTLLAMPVAGVLVILLGASLLFVPGNGTFPKLEYTVLALAGCGVGVYGWNRLRGGDARRAFVRGLATGACLVFLLASACGGFVLLS